MKRVYIDSTLHHPWNLAFNPRLCAALEERGVSCYLPQRDTDQAGTKQDIWTQNTKAVSSLPVLLAVAQNETPNWGVEVGFAFAKGKKLVALVAKDHDIPLMARHMFNIVVPANDLEDISSYIDELVKVLS